MCDSGTRLKHCDIYFAMYILKKNKVPRTTIRIPKESLSKESPKRNNISSILSKLHDTLFFGMAHYTFKLRLQCK